jgi:serine/threonine protein kinase
MAVMHPPAFAKQAGAEPLPGYRLLEPLGRGGFGEVWKCEVPGGLRKAIKFVRNDPEDFGRRSSLEQELHAFQSIKEVRHPFILSLERVELIAGELLMVMELADANLQDRLAECQEAGQPGVPRDELLGFLLEAAEALDVMNFQHGLQHLDVKPTNLFVVSHHLKVGDFGLVNRLERPADDTSMRENGVTPLYVAPEILCNKIHRNSDQYNLALAYQELLTGAHPCTGTNPRQVMVQQLAGQLDLAPLPEADRPWVVRALSRDPEQRFPSCMAFVLALLAGQEHAAGSPSLLLRNAVRRDADAPSSSSGTRLKGDTRAASYTRPLKRPPATSRGPVSDSPTLALGGPTSAVAPPAPAGDLSLPGYEMVGPVSRGALGEVWQVRDAGGRARLARFLPPELTGDTRAFDRLVAWYSMLRHPALPGLDLIRDSGGRAVLVADAFGLSLQDYFRQCRDAGAPGIPREVLLDCLGAAAEVLDELHGRHGVQHLGLSPRHLLIEGDRLYIAEFGLLEMARLATGHLPGAGAYLAPELADGQVSPACDQYSLALIFVELLTGKAPRPARARPRPGGPARVDLDALTADDRPAVARALHPDPAQRFPTCGELIDALELASGRPAPDPTPAVELPPLLPFASLRTGGPVTGALPTPGHFLDLLLTAATRAQALARAESGATELVWRDGGVGCRFPMRLLSGMARLKIDSFREEWGAQLVAEDGRSFRLEIREAPSFWRRCLGQQGGVAVAVCLLPGHGRDPSLIEVEASARPFGPAGPLAARFAEVGPQLLESARQHLQNLREQRAVTRWPFAAPVHVYPVLADGTRARVLAGSCRDVSRGGIRLALPCAPGAPRAYFHFPGLPELAEFALLAEFLRVREEQDGGCGAAAAFRAG